MITLPSIQLQHEILDEIIKGAQNKKCVYIRYQDKKLDWSERFIEPYEIKNGKLFAHCLLKKGTRAFIMTNIYAAIMSDVSFNPRYPILIQAPEK